MALPAPGHFVHRTNHEGTFDSICCECVRTIATAQCETDLDEAESEHTCDPSDLEHIARLQYQADLWHRRAPVQSETGQTGGRDGRRLMGK